MLYNLLFTFILRFNCNKFILASDYMVNQSPLPFNRYITRLIYLTSLNLNFFLCKWKWHNFYFDQIRSQQTIACSPNPICNVFGGRPGWCFYLWWVVKNKTIQDNKSKEGYVTQILCDLQSLKYSLSGLYR